MLPPPPMRSAFVNGATLALDGGVHLLSKL